MSKFISYVNTAAYLITHYSGDSPFHLYIGQYFAANKKYGSKDRKSIKELCYSFFRASNMLSGGTLENKIKAALLVCSKAPNVLLAGIDEKLNELAELPLLQKQSYLVESGFVEKIQPVFPWIDELSEGVDGDYFQMALLQQPDVFLRIRPGCKQGAVEKLQQSDVEFELIDDAIRLFQNVDVSKFLSIDKEVVIQDYSSQRLGEYFEKALENFPKNKKIKVWDACAGSGGKSLLMYDLNKEIELTVSDVRPSILSNLQKRFLNAGIRSFQMHQIDLTKLETLHPINGKTFDIIICDVPCTGSGTWSRNPENLLGFNKKVIKDYASLQKKILNNVLPFLSKEGMIIYSTCSVLKQENEQQLEVFCDSNNIRMINKSIIHNPQLACDYLFVGSMRG